MEGHSLEVFETVGELRALHVLMEVELASVLDSNSQKLVDVADQWVLWGPSIRRLIGRPLRRLDG